MSALHFDILYEVIREVDVFKRKDRQAALISLSLVCHSLSDAIRPILFHEVTWPHPNKHNNERGLHFLPEVLWPYIHRFHLDWPDHWPDVFPPLWGTKSPGEGIYVPKHMDKLEAALPRMTNIKTLQIMCPFHPPRTLLAAIVKCPNITDLRIIDTPIHVGDVLAVPQNFLLTRLTLGAVGEAVRVGEGPYNKKFQDLSFYTREYRKRYGGEIGLSSTAHPYIFRLGRTDSLTYLQLSSKYVNLNAFRQYEWPALETFVLTGAPLRRAWAPKVPLVDVIARMPKLFDLRLLFAKSNRKDDELTQIVPPRYHAHEHSPASVLSQIRYLALSNAYDSQDLLHYTSFLERLSVSAIIATPRIPIALTRQDVDQVLDDLAIGGGNVGLKRLRLMTEDELNFSLFEKIGRICPALEFVEVELCGYREGEAGFEWTDYGDAFSTYAHLQELRVGIPFAGCDEHDEHDGQDLECIRSDRRDCAIYLASRVPTLRRISFEYRTRTGSHRHEDRWLDFDVIRLGDGKIRDIRVAELDQSWYPIPEIWERVPLYDY
ncbi:hypothetical protein NLJ89_g4960 [Agrocybe chaxingu]|uniref:Uncharacterized protein n=1 Tax=Agrocybe chaxingu TaxID=84603 RepID=A0A9W8K8Z6_9AGAR|nr:hypothetical protein NLJ89_g4960 [Agrocybe chaxingu]